jgi:hypothetical protein
MAQSGERLSTAWTGAEVKLAHGVTLLGKFDGEFASCAALVAALS